MDIRTDIAAHTLAGLGKGQRARIASISADDPHLALKLREMGFSEGDSVELVTRGPFGGQPLAIRLNRTLIAMRLSEASAIAVVAADD